METYVAAALRAAVEDWLQATAQPERQSCVAANPAALGLELGLTVKERLEREGHAPTAMRDYMLVAPFCHLKDIFGADDLVDTPANFFPVPNTASTVVGRAAALAVHAALHLETVSYGSENHGNLFVNLVVMSGPGALAEKSTKSMRGHTDAVSFPFNGEDDPEDERIAPSPDLVTLVGLRNPMGVATRVMPLTDIFPCLQPGDVDELKKLQYSIRSQKTFVEGTKRILGKEHVVFDQPVLKDVAEGTWIRYSHTSVVSSSGGGKAEKASEKLEGACNKAAIPIVVQPGDILIINNRLSLHGRDGVAEKAGGQSRWLLRTYGLDTSKLPEHKRRGNAFPRHVLFP